MENAVDSAVDGGFDIPVEGLERMGADLIADVLLGEVRVGLGDGLPDDVDMDNDRRIVPNKCVGDGRGDVAKEAPLFNRTDLIGDEPFFFIVVTANGDIASMIA